MTVGGCKWKQYW